MSKIAIMTDSNSSLTQSQGKEMGVTVIPMPFFINGEEYLEDINLTQEDFFKMLNDGANVSTSQPSIGLIKSTWDELLKENDYGIYFPMSSGLSKSCEVATKASEEEPYNGKVKVIDNGRISVPQTQAILDCKEMINRGYEFNKIVEVLTKNGMNHDIFIMLDTLDYLRKGGRITAAAHKLGGFLRLKPVLMIKGEKLDSYKMRNRSIEGAKKIVKDACRACINGYMKDIDGRTDNVHLEVAYSGCDTTEALKLVEEIKAEFNVSEVRMAPLSLSVACHTGPGASGMAVCKAIPDKIEEC